VSERRDATSGRRPSTSPVCLCPPGIDYYPRQANFVCANIDHARLVAAFDASGLSIRPGEDLGLPGWVRITVGWAPSMTALRAVLRRCT
jgi:histidinol-phosphate aminotransferase